MFVPTHRRMHHAPAPGEVFVHAGPVQSEREAEQQLLERDAVHQSSAQRGKIPDFRDVPGREPLEPQHEHGVEAEEEDPPEDGVGPEPGTTEDRRDRAEPEDRNGRVDGIPRQEVERHE